MKQLVYGVIREAQAARCLLPAGVEAAAVGFAAAGGLAAACSVVPDACAAPTVSRATAYARVVAAIHRDATVAPFRYGHFLADREQTLRLLRAHQAEFLHALDAVEGCDEMGLRILLDNRSEPPAAPSVRPAPGESGRDYLAGRRAFYAARECDSALAAQAVATARRTLDALAVKCREERAAGTAGRLASLVFLVRRAGAGRFREAFRRLEQESAAKMLLTGPWPPYSFVGNWCTDGQAEPN